MFFTVKNEQKLNNTHISALTLLPQMLQMTGVSHITLEHKSYDDKRYLIFFGIASLSH